MDVDVGRVLVELNSIDDTDKLDRDGLLVHREDSAAQVGIFEFPTSLLQRKGGERIWCAQSGCGVK